ncbi:MAG: hypothetical protein C4297_06220 [Gemmataceae bacterium]
MHLRTTFVLFGLAVVLLGVFFLLQFAGVERPEQVERRQRYILPSLNDPSSTVTAGQFTRLVIERYRHDASRQEKIEFVRKDKDWRMIHPKDVRTDTSRVNMLVDQIMRAETMRHSQPLTDLGKVGLDSPDTIVTLYRDEQSYVVSIGNRDPKKDPVLYVTTSERPNEGLPVPRQELDRIWNEVDEFRNRELLGSAFDIVGVSLSGKARPALELEKVEDRDWHFREPKYGPADNRAVEDFVRDLVTARVERTSDFVADGPQVDLRAYGLADDQVNFRLTLKHKGKDDKSATSETLLVGAYDATGQGEAGYARRLAGALPLGEGAALMGSFLTAVGTAGACADPTVGSYYARLADDQSVVRIAAKYVGHLRKSADALRSRALVKLDVSKVDAVDIAAGGETLRLRRHDLKGPADWTLYTRAEDRVKAHPQVVPNLLDALNKVELADEKAFLDTSEKQRAWFGDEPVDLGLDRPQAEVTIWIEGIQRDQEGKPQGTGEPPLKKEAKDKPTVRLIFGRKDSKRRVVYVKRQSADGAQAILAVPDPWVAKPDQLPGSPPPSFAREHISLTELVTGGYYAFRDHTLPSFVVTEATSLTLERHGISVTLEKEGTGSEARWRVKKPVDAPASAKIETLLNSLAGLTIERLVSDKPSDADLKEKFALAQPWLRWTVTVADKDKKTSRYVYAIGRTTDPQGPMPNRFYGRLEHHPAEGSAPESNQFVFLLMWETVRALDIEPRDGLLWPAEKERPVEHMIFTWRKPGGDGKLEETRLELAYQQDKKEWVVQALTVQGKDARSQLPTLDQTKIQGLLGASVGTSGPRLVPLTTERFVSYRGKPPTAWRLDPDQATALPTLVVEVRLQDKSTRRLLVGERFEPKDHLYPGLAHKAYYYAAASTLPEAVFLLDEDAWKDLAAGPNYFAAAPKKTARR